MATYSSVLAWRIPGTEEPGGLPSTGSHRVRHDWNDLAAAASVAHLWDDQQGWAYDWEQFSVLKLMDTCGSWTNFNIFLGSFLFPVWLSPFCYQFPHVLNQSLARKSSSQCELLKTRPDTGGTKGRKWVDLQGHVISLSMFICTVTNILLNHHVTTRMEIFSKGNHSSVGLLLIHEYPY